ncbi:MAG: hypothetical protein INH41_01980 [Myxococcaceae bacterium]|jgi:hypothetical protein|nr:hypothetical protein [Myxococcaceae bacterium]MCA3011147.1 hypothetical protein [Myxococcaceae bacterium]
MFLDLHRHLEGSHSPAALARVAQRFDVRTPLFFDAATGAFRSPDALAAALTLEGPSDDASRFYRCITLARQAYVSVEAIGALAEAAFEEAAAETDGFELRVSLFSMTRALLENQGRAVRDLAPVTFAEAFARPVLLAVLAARDAVARATRKPMVVRLGLSRTFESEPHYRAMADVAVEHAADLVGLDVLGIVPPPDPEPLPRGLLAILERLRRHLPDLTIHAGEFDGHASVDRTLALSPRGIGHGVHALESPATLERLAESGVTLEVCPTSNHLLIPTALARLQRLHGAEPMVALQRAHVHCVLGSDDPTPMGTSFTQELARARAIGVDLPRLEADMLRRWEQMTGARLGPA